MLNFGVCISKQPGILNSVVVLDIFYFHPDPWGNDPIWRAYFSNGLVQSPASKQPTAVASLQHQTIHFLDARTERRNQKMEVLTLSNTVICLLSRVLSEGFRWCSPFFFSTWETCFQLGKYFFRWIDIAGCIYLFGGPCFYILFTCFSIEVPTFPIAVLINVFCFPTRQCFGFKSYNFLLPLPPEE